jgi:flagellar biosynthesis/type III secretory pathway M-ring protein FliF/YscJ
MTKEKKQIYMEPTDEFRDFGKKLPYQEPTGFFDQLSEKTLNQAKLREQHRRKTVVLWRTVAVAASLSALALLGYFMFEPERPVNNPIVQEKQPVEQQIVPKQEIPEQPEVAEIKKAVPEKVSEKIVAKENNTEEIADVLADLSDEELSQLAAMYKADPFISESEQ